MEEASIIASVDGPIMTITLNRPDSHNALTPEMIGLLTDLFHDAAQMPDVRVVVLAGHGRSFCAGADLGFMRAAADFTFEQNRADAETIFDLMVAVNDCPKPVIGRVQGVSIGGGAGLISCCDIVVAEDRASFGFSEARLGIVPAVISPFVVAKIGPGPARELFLTGERFSATTALNVGLVQHLVDAAELDTLVAERITSLLLAAPGAQAAIKSLIREVSYRPPADVRDFTTGLIAQRRASEEGREGMSAFLERRRPTWQELDD